MRRLALAAGAACALAGFAGRAGAQVNTMPGQVVGSGFTLKGVGSQFPAAAPPAGQPINLPAENERFRRYDPSRPYDVFKGSTFSPDQLVAPIPGAGDQNILTRLYDKLKGVVGLNTVVPTDPGRSGYFPSLTRRNRERAEERLWRRD